MEHKSGFVNIIGKPNVGKSTVTNLLLGEKLSIVTHKAQTTRHRILALINDEHFQIVLSDTPGIISDPKYKMQESMNQFAFSTFEDADVMLVMVVMGERFEEQSFVLDNINAMKGVKILLLNKSDQLTSEEIEHELGYWRSLAFFDNCLAISALDTETRILLLDEIIKYLPEHPAYFPKDQLSDKTERFFVSEMIREQILLLYHQEIPYSAEVVVEDFKEDEEAQPPIIRIRAEIYVNRKTQKSIIIGKGGASIKALGIASREALEKFFNCKIYLELFVRVKENWRDDERTLRNFGYNQ